MSSAHWQSSSSRMAGLSREPMESSSVAIAAGCEPRQTIPARQLPAFRLPRHRRFGVARCMRRRTGLPGGGAAWRPAWRRTRRPRSDPGPRRPKPGTGWAVCTVPCPRNTEAPSRRAYWASSPSSQVLPPPDSASSRTTPGWPAARSTWDFRIDSSAPRPIKAGSVSELRRSKPPTISGGSTSPRSSACRRMSTSAKAPSAD